MSKKKIKEEVGEITKENLANKFGFVSMCESYYEVHSMLYHTEEAVKKAIACEDRTKTHIYFTINPKAEVKYEVKLTDLTKK